jgi:hypothetical protein
VSLVSKDLVPSPADLFSLQQSSFCISTSSPSRWEAMDKSGGAEGRGHTHRAEELGVAPVWARIPGFPWWPARLCAAYEEKMIANRRPRSKHVQVAVVFLGRCEK